MPALSARGQRAFARPPLLKCSLFECQFTCQNRSGVISLGIAENSRLFEQLVEYYRRTFALDYTDLTYGTALTGSVRLFSALSHLFSQYFNPHVPVSRNHIVAGSGCSSIIDSVVSCTADAGDGILVAKPYYNGFVASFECRNGVQAVGVSLEQGQEADSGAIAAFERALQESNARGVKIRAVMLCNPHNPLGFCYTRETLLEYCKFVEKHDLHLISDEIYALSTFDTPEYPDAVPFTSVLALDVKREAGCDPSRVHCIYGASKDWGCNGLRVGCLVSQYNPELVTAMESSALLLKISSVSDALWSTLLLDKKYLPEYVDMNRRVLAESHADAVSWLKGHDIPFRPSNAGHFIWCDLTKFLPETNSEGEPLPEGMAREEELFNRFAANRVIVARGAAYGCETAGFFRLTFTIRQDFFQIGLGRVEKALGLSVTRGEREERIEREREGRGGETTHASRSGPDGESRCMSHGACTEGGLRDLKQIESEVDALNEALASVSV
ncbi:hypothetical protein ACM66B_001919 [Microbotryomycetes sp. NB124-2]